MNFGPLRALALELAFQAHGVPATVTRPAPDDDPIEAQVIWLRFVTEDMPVGLSVNRREARRAMALRRADVPAVPRGTAIVAPEKAGDPLQVWRVDGTLSVEADQTRVLVVLDAAATELL